MTTVTITGDKQLRARLIKAGGAGKKAAGRALYAGANRIFRQSQSEVPVQYGILRGSGRVTMEGETSVSISYGGAASDYAIYVHERMDVHHPHGKAKFLEDPMTQLGPAEMRKVAQAVGKAMR